MNHPINPLHIEIASLRKRLDVLEAENLDLRLAIIPDNNNLVIRFGFTRSESEIVTLLAKGGIFSKLKIADAILSEGATLKTVDVHICRIRKKIAPRKITTLWGCGYSFEGEHLAAIRAVIAGEA